MNSSTLQIITGVTSFLFTYAEWMTNSLTFLGPKGVMGLSSFVGSLTGYFLAQMFNGKVVTVTKAPSKFSLPKVSAHATDVLKQGACVGAYSALATLFVSLLPIGYEDQKMFPALVSGLVAWYYAGKEDYMATNTVQYDESQGNR